MSKFIESANSRETSVELMEAILYVAGSEEAAARLWEEPTEAEALAVWERVTKNGLIDSTDFDWGAAGANWATALGIVRSGYAIVDQFSHLNGTDAGREAVEEYESAAKAGKDHDEAQIMASNVLQRAGYNVNSKGGVTIRAAE